MDLTEVDLQRTCREIWAAMVGLDLKPNPASEHQIPDDRVVTGTVQITGDWSGAVTVQCSERLARRAAAAMFAVAEDEVTDDEVTDTMGELANVTGGNVKPLLSGNCQLSLPSVTTGRDYAVVVPGARSIDRTTSDCDGELVVATLLQRTGS